MSLTTSQEKTAEWKDKIHQQKISGRSILAWCRENQILPRSFYYWRSKLFPKIIDRSCFTELADNKSSDIMIEYQGAHINLDKDFNSETLKKCLIVLRGIQC